MGIIKASKMTSLRLPVRFLSRTNLCVGGTDLYNLYVCFISILDTTVQALPGLGPTPVFEKSHTNVRIHKIIYIVLMSTKIKFTVLWQIYFVCVEPPKSWLQVPFRNNTHANMCGVVWYYFSSAYEL